MGDPYSGSFDSGTYKHKILEGTILWAFCFPIHKTKRLHWMVSQILYDLKYSDCGLKWYFSKISPWPIQPIILITNSWHRL